MKYLIVLFGIVLLLSNKSFPQLSKYPHGTLIVAFICEDGIVIAADSRSSFTSFVNPLHKEIPYAYLDSTQKISKLGHFLIAIRGTGNIGKRFWEDIIRRYNKLHRPDPTLEIAFNNFKFYLKSKLKVSDSLIDENEFVLVGYEKYVPVILSWNNMHGLHKTSKVSHFLISNDCILESLKSVTVFNSANVRTAVEKGFNKCGTTNVSIGGPVNILKIKPDNNIVELNSFKFKRFKNYMDFVKSIISYKTKVVYIYPEMEKAFRDTLISNIKRKLY